MKSRRSHRGWFAAEAMIGLAVVVVLTAALATSVTSSQRAAQRLADARAAARLAEATITALQTGRPAPAAPTGATVQVQRLAHSTDLPPGSAWANVTVNFNGRTADLTGLVRADALKEATP